jgi:recombination protein RecT
MAEERNPLNDLRETLQKMGGQFKAVLPTQQHVDRFIRVVMTAVQQNPKLISAERASFYAACMKSAQDGLMPDGKEAVLKIYSSRDGNAWIDKVGYEPMVEGLLKKLRLSGEVIGAPRVHVVRQGDDFDYQLGDDERIIHKPRIEASGEIVAAYSIVKLKSGDTSREVMSRAEIDGIMLRSKSKDKEGNLIGPWKTDFSEMCRKTVFKRHYKRLPRSSDLDNLINDDNDLNGATDIERVQARDVQPVSTQAPTQRPAALAAVAAAGGTPVPEAAQKQRQPVTIDQQQDTGAGSAGAPQDII